MKPGFFIIKMATSTSIYQSVLALRQLRARMALKDTHSITCLSYMFKIRSIDQMRDVPQDRDTDAGSLPAGRGLLQLGRSQGLQGMVKNGEEANSH